MMKVTCYLNSICLKIFPGMAIILAVTQCELETITHWYRKNTRKKLEYKTLCCTKNTGLIAVTMTLLQYGCKDLRNSALGSALTFYLPVCHLDERGHRKQLLIVSSLVGVTQVGYLTKIKSPFLNTMTWATCYTVTQQRYTCTFHRCPLACGSQCRECLL